MEIRAQVSSYTAIMTAILLCSTSSKVTAATYPVKVTDYGAKCDGATDDTAAVKAAITAAQGGSGTINQGGTLVFPAGTCVVSGSDTIVLERFSAELNR